MGSPSKQHTRHRALNICMMGDSIIAWIACQRAITPGGSPFPSLRVALAIDQYQTAVRTNSESVLKHGKQSDTVTGARLGSCKTVDG